MSEVSRHFDMLNKIPCPIAKGYCDECGTARKKLQRCTRCKKAFYCNRVCQTKGWVESHHKYECSFLPIGHIKYPAKMEASEYAQLKNEVQRISLIMWKWLKEYVEGGSTGNPADYPALKDLTLPAAYSSEGYTRSLPSDPFRNHIIRIIRLFAIEWVATLAEGSTDTLDIRVFSQYLNTPFAQMTLRPNGKLNRIIWLPKVMHQPGDLSPMEYLGLPRIMWAVNMKGRENIWPDLEGGATNDETEVGYAMRFSNLMSVTTAALEYSPNIS